LNLAVLGRTVTKSFNGKLRDELLNGEIFYTLKEAQILIALAMGRQYGKASQCIGL